MRIILLLATVLTASATAFAANKDLLPRRGYLGVAMDTKGPAADRGVHLTDVLPESSALAAGLQKEDVLLRLNGEALEGPGRLAMAIKAIGRARSGETLDVTVLRGGAEQKVPVMLKEFPREASPDFDTVYDAVNVDGALHRVIVTTPKSAGPHPTMFYIQGVGCSSVEAPTRPKDAVRLFIDGVTRAGFATLRVEKSGCGDNQNTPCEEIDFKTEEKAYLAAFDYAAKRDGLDAKHIYLFGHSMGGAYAPLIATERPVAGIIVYGTIGAPLQQYFKDVAVRQYPMSGLTGAMLDARLKLNEEFIKLFYAERLTPAQVIERAPNLRAFMRGIQGDDTHLLGRHYTFWHQLDDLKLPSPWAKVTVPVLALWGTADYPATREDHPLIVSTVNAQHPGLAEFREVAGTGHGFDQAASMAESMKNGMQGEFNPAVVTICAEWMKGVPSKG